MISVVGVLYAVMLAFIVIIVWQEYDTSASRVLVAISFVVIAELDYPYRGDTGVSNNGWAMLRDGIKSEVRTQ